MIDPVTYWSRLAAAFAVSGRTWQQLLETTSASGKVVAARTGPAARDSWIVGSPANREAGRMIPEKMTAAAASGQAMSAAWWKVQVELTDQSARTLALLSKGRPPTWAEASDFWSNSALSALRMFEGAAGMGRDSLRPYHRATAANVRRLHAG